MRGDIAHPGQRADPDHSVTLDDVAQRQTVDVDDRAVALGAVLHQVQQVRSARDEPCVGLSGQPHRIGDVPRRGVREVLHFAASWMAATMFG
jgi:hypothetical protein